MDARHTPWRVETRTKASRTVAMAGAALLALAFAAPLFASRSVIQDLFFILTMLTLAQNWNLLAGYAGLVSVGQQAFVGFGAYAMFACVILLDLDPILSILIAGIAAACLAVPTAFFAFRLQGAYFAIGTWVIAEVVRLTLAQWKALGGGTGTSLPSGTARSMWGAATLRDTLGVKSSEAGDILTYWLALILAILTIGLIYALLRSKHGLGLAAMRDNQEAARSVGVDARRIKFLVYLAASFGTGLTGALIYVQKARISPDAAFSVIDWTAYVIFIVVIGGIGTIEGPIVGVLVYYVLRNLLADFGSWYLLLLGLIGIAIMLFAPRGLWGLFSARTGIQLFPVRRRLLGGQASIPITARSKTREIHMADITTDVLIIGTGPAGSATAALLATQGVPNIVVNRYRWLADTPRAHITNQRAMEVLRDLGKEVEAEGYLYGTNQDLMGENVFCTSLAGEEIGRMRSWGKHPLSRAEHILASPCHMNDMPQTFMEPLLFKTACSRGTQARMSTVYLRHEQDESGVTTTCLDRLTDKEITIRSKYLVGADGGNSKVAEDIGLPFEGKMGVAGSMNILFRADLSKYVAHRPSVLYWVLQPGANVGGIGMGLVRMVRPWHEWLIVWGYDINQPAPVVDKDFATKVARDLVGEPGLEIDFVSASTWTVNNMYATHLQKGRVFCMGDAIHRHPPSNGLGSNTSIQDAFNLAWKLAAVLKAQAGPALLDSYSQERAPIAKQIVTRANQSIEEFGPIFKALGLLESVDPVIMQANMDARCDNTAEAEEQRRKIRAAIAFKVYEFDAHGVDMNQRYRSSNAIVTDGEAEPPFARDRELHYQPTTWPGARLPHVWLHSDRHGKVSSLDLAGKGRFALFTGIGGEGWIAAAKRVGEEFGMTIAVNVIGPRQEWQDLTGDWANARQVRDSGIVLTRPDQHVCWRRNTIADDPTAELLPVFRQILNR